LSTILHTNAPERRDQGAEGGQKLAGHASISSTARYAHCEMDELREAVEIVQITHTGPTPVPALVAID
jgi:hypothetical protein